MTVAKATGSRFFSQISNSGRISLILTPHPKRTCSKIDAIPLFEGCTVKPHNLQKAGSNNF
jgi:hypothetical protein